MNVLERLRPEPQPLDAEWSAATLRHIFASHSPTSDERNARVRRRRFAGGAVATATVAATVLGLTTTGASPAFAVKEASNGNVVVSIYRLTDAAQLEKVLGEHGIDAKVNYLRTQVPSDLDDGSDPTTCSPGQDVGASVQPEEGGFEITFERSYLDSHRGAEMSLTAAGGRSADDWAGLKIEWSDGRC